MEIISIAEAATFLGVSESLIRRMIADDRITAYVDLAEVDAKMRSTRTG